MSISILYLNYLAPRLRKMGFCAVCCSAALLYPMSAYATCQDVRLEPIRPINFGTIRLSQEANNGLVTLWPSGEYNLSQGLSLARGIKPTVGQIRLYAAPNTRVELFAEVQETTSNNRHVIENLQFYSHETEIEQNNERLSLIMPDISNADQLTDQVSLTITFSANLYINEKVTEFLKVQTAIRVRCLSNT